MVSKISKIMLFSTTIAFLDINSINGETQYTHTVPEIGSTKVIPLTNSDFPKWQSTDGEYLNTEISTQKGYKYGNYIFRAYYNYNGIDKNACGSTFLYSKYPMNQSPYIKYARWRELDFEYVPYQFANTKGDKCSGKSFGFFLEGRYDNPSLAGYRYNIDDPNNPTKFDPLLNPEKLVTKEGVAKAQVSKFSSWNDLLEHYSAETDRSTQVGSEYGAGDYVWKYYYDTEETTTPPNNPYASISLGPHFMIPGKYKISGDLIDYSGNPSGTFNGYVLKPDANNEYKNPNTDWPIATPGQNYAMSTSFFYDKNNVMSDGLGYNGQGWYFYRFELLPSGCINYYIGEGELPSDGSSVGINKIKWFQIGMQPENDICNAKDFFSSDTLADKKWWYEGEWRESGLLVGLIQIWFQKGWGDGTPDVPFVNMFFDYVGFYPVSDTGEATSTPDWYVNTRNWNSDDWPDKFNKYFIQDKYVPGSVTFGDPDNTTDDDNLECREALQLRIFQLDQIPKYYPEGKEFTAFSHTFSNQLAKDYPKNPAVLVAYYSKSDEDPYLVRLWVNYDTENNGVQYASNGTVLEIYELDNLDKFVNSSGNFIAPTTKDLSELTKIGEVEFACNPKSGRTVKYNSVKGSKFQIAVIAQPKVVTGITPFQIQVLGKDEQLPPDPAPINPKMENLNFGFALPSSTVSNITFTVNKSVTSVDNPDKSKGQRLYITFPCSCSELPQTVKATFTDSSKNTKEVDVDITTSGWEITNGGLVNIAPSGQPANYCSSDNTQYITVPVSAVNNGFPTNK